MVSLLLQGVLSSGPVQALDVVVEVAYTATDLPAQRCTAAAVEWGDLLSVPPQEVGGARLTVLVGVEGATSRGEVLWETAVKTQQPGLLSVARPTAPGRHGCPPGRSCRQTFARQEQSLTVTATFQGSVLPPPPLAVLEGQGRLTWDQASWYREARPLDCAPIPVSPTEAMEGGEAGGGH